MRGWREHGTKAGATAIALAVMVVSMVVAQDAPPPTSKAAPPSNKARTNKKGGLRAPGGGRPKATRKAGDPLAVPGLAPANGDPAALGADQPLPAAGTFRYKFKITVADVGPMAATFYPSKLTSTAPVVLLIHERDRSDKDFDETIVELKGLSLAEDLQKQGYAVLSIDLRGHGANPRRTLTRSEWQAAVQDLQSAYACLVDRHNWGELNLAKLGVVALGEGANLAVTWAANGGGVSSEGRTSDLGALVLVSPMIDAQSQGLPAAGAISQMAARVPMALLVGERDTASFGLVDSVANVVKRVRANRVETFPSALHGYKMLRLEPNLTASITKFLESTIKANGVEWEGRYLLTPVTYTDVKIIPNPTRADAATKKAAAPVPPPPPAPPAPATKDQAK